MATVIHKVKLMLDENQEPFIPFVTTDGVFKEGTDQTMTEYIDLYIADKDEQFETVKEETEEAISAIILDLNQKVESGYFDGPQGPQGEQGIQGAPGNSGVHMGPTEPTDPLVSLWVDTSDPVVLNVAEEETF